jgi:Xaa-Pro aminopeptidase
MAPAIKRKRDSDTQMSALEKVTAVRALMREYGYTAFIVPSEDAHMSEYVAACDCRRAFISSFDGSAGIVVITLDDALCWTDGRYFVQAEAQLDADVFKMMRLHEDPSVDSWLASNMPEGAVIGVDGMTFSVGSYERLVTALASHNSTVTLQALPSTVPNFVDQVWGDDRPPSPSAAVTVHAMKYAGKSAADKLDGVREAMRGKGATHLVVAGLDEVAWLLNLRGSDVEYNPVFWSYVVVTLDGATLYCESSKFSAGVAEALAADRVDVRPYGSLLEDLGEKVGSESCVWIDPTVCNYSILLAVQAHTSGKSSEGTDSGDGGIISVTGPIPLAKAKKNDVELAGVRAAHLRDAVAVVKFLAWLEAEVVEHGRRPTECEAGDKLDGLRAELDLYVSLSFPTISSSGANGAIIHYRPMPETCARIDGDHVYLVDSGGQYRDGTTDITRTVHFGSPTAWEKECFTRVLRGHIALDSAVFPRGTTGHLLDAFARRPLWEIGRDYKHGTGHGVGSALCVHEGPHVLSFKPAAQATALEAGFLTSNEPGYYETGGFGIRIENILAVAAAGGDKSGPDRPFLEMETLTFVPMQHKMMEPELMTHTEKAWVDAYHAQCREKIAPLLADDPAALAWLERNTKAMFG